MTRRLDHEDLYRHANAVFPDDADLAAFNLLYEIRNGLLLPVEPEELPGDDAKLIVMIGYLDLGDEFWIMQSVGGLPDAEAVMEKAKARILDLPLETEEEGEFMPTVEREFPTAIAALGVWRTPDGATRFAVYRHPDIPAHRAYATLKEVVAEAAAKDAGAGQLVSGDN